MTNTNFIGKDLSLPSRLISVLVSTRSKQVAKDAAVAIANEVLKKSKVYSVTVMRTKFFSSKVKLVLQNEFENKDLN